MRPSFMLLLGLAAWLVGCSSTYKVQNSALRQACNNGDKVTCSAYTAAVADCERHLGGSRSLLRESWSTNNCTGHN
jgi:hypothetical protein